MATAPSFSSIPNAYYYITENGSQKGQVGRRIECTERGISWLYPGSSRGKFIPWGPSHQLGKGDEIASCVLCSSEKDSTLQAPLKIQIRDKTGKILVEAKFLNKEIFDREIKTSLPYDTYNKVFSSDQEVQAFYGKSDEDPWAY